jgi:hypothetical protein
MALQSPTQTNGHLRGREIAGGSGIERDRARGEFSAWRWLTPFIATNGRGCVCVHTMQVEGGASQQL